MKTPKYAKQILQSLLIGGALYIALSSPFGAGRLFKEISKELKRKKERDRFLWTLKYLRRKQLINYQEKNGKVRIDLTEDGKSQALIYSLDTLKLPQEGRWDGKWRVVAFDIPEQLRKGRDALRNKMQELGCVQLQKSLWVWPYECRNEIDFIAETFHVGKYVHYLVAESVTSEKFLLYKFNFNK